MSLLTIQNTRTLGRTTANRDSSSRKSWLHAPETKTRSADRAHELRCPQSENPEISSKCSLFGQYAVRLFADGMGIITNRARVSERETNCLLPRCKASRARRRCEVNPRECRDLCWPGLPAERRFPNQTTCYPQPRYRSSTCWPGRPCFQHGKSGKIHYKL